MTAKRDPCTKIHGINAMLIPTPFLLRECYLFIGDRDSSVQSVSLSIGRLGVRSTATEWIAVVLLGKDRSPQSPRQEAQFRLRPAANCRHQKYDRK